MPISYDPGWTSVERAVWGQISAGREVRLPGPCPDWQATSVPQDAPVVFAAYTISGRFLQQIMTENPYRSVTAELPVAISGARIVGDVVVTGGRSLASVTLACSTLEGGMQFTAWETVQPLKLVRVRVTKDVVFTDLTARSDVVVQRSDVEAVRVTKSRIDGSLSLRGSRVRSVTRIVGVNVAHGPLMGCAITGNSEAGEVCYGLYGGAEIISVKTRMSMELDHSVFSGDVRLQAVEVGGTLLARRVQHEKAFTIIGGKIAGRLEMDGGASHGPIHIEGLRVQQGVSLRKGSYPEIAIIAAEVSSGLDFRASKLRRLDLSGTTVRGELRLGMKGGELDWGAPGDDAYFVARNTSVRSLQDTEASWPSWLRRELDGFEYQKLGGFEEPQGDAPYLRGADWFKQWLAGDESYSPQPYRHLSELLRREGQVQAANAILYEAKERERAALSWRSRERVWLEFLRLFVGYGVGLWGLLTLAWMAAFALVGWIVGICTTRGSGFTASTLFWHSVAYTVPGFGVAREDGECVQVSPRARNWFYVQRLCCYGLALLAAAASIGVIRP